MGRIIAIANQKGGVGKTTTAINVATALRLGGYRCLVVDADPQCNATTGLGLEPLSRHPWVSKAPLAEFVRTSSDGPDVLPGSPCRADADTLSVSRPGWVEKFSGRFADLVAGYDVVLIDCPPSLGHITRTCLYLATDVVIPLQCEYFAMEGLALMFDLVRYVARQRARTLQVGGILLNLFDPSWELAKEVAEEVREHLGEQVFAVVVPRDEAVSEASSHGQSVLSYAPRSRGAVAYLLLTLELCDRLRLEQSCNTLQAAA